MEPLFISHTKATPRIILDESKGEFSITGRSIPADAPLFYAPVDKWVEQFTAGFSGKSVTVDIKLDHLNTGSVRSILTILSRFLKMKERHVEVKVNWHYETEDEDIRDKGEEMSLIVDHPFTYLTFTDFF